jgi:lipopolysaccharide/colanic/teichoic acid biosynthesis glycosyltransferase
MGQEKSRIAFSLAEQKRTMALDDAQNRSRITASLGAQRVKEEEKTTRELRNQLLGRNQIIASLGQQRAREEALTKQTALQTAQKRTAVAFGLAEQRRQERASKWTSYAGHGFGSTGGISGVLSFLGRGMSSIVTGVVSGVTTAAVTAGINGLVGLFKMTASAAWELASTVFSLGAEFEKTAVSFEVMTGSADKGKQVLDDLRKVAISSPYTFRQLSSPTSRGSILYSETRISKGKPFKIFKFRIFKTSASNKYFNDHGFIQTKALESNAKNLTFTGKILKQIYMDELPQLFNVLKGNMTLVGPRPSNVVVTWQDGQAGIFQRYLFTCGITGPFQVLKDSPPGISQNQLDIEYILFCKNNPGIKVVLNDLKILLATVMTVLRAKGI